jgi:hypothetical protein
VKNSAGTVAIRPGFVVATVTVLLGAFMVVAGVWAIIAPASFAEFTQYAFSEHFVHDAGAFQIGIGATLFLSLVVRDSVVVALAGYLVSNSIHAGNHAIDLHLGGHKSDFWLLAAISVITAIALFMHLRAIGRSKNSVSTDEQNTDNRGDRAPRT